jgi:triosephosphate isomerase
MGGANSELLAGCKPEEVARAALIYEPEWTIGGMEPAPPDTIAEGCGFLRHWIRKAFGRQASEGLRIIYGGSVAAENAEKLLASSEVDGLGAGRKGRDPVAFAQIVKLIARVKGVVPSKRIVRAVWPSAAFAWLESLSCHLSLLA